jgi:hypothetical protein
MELLENIGFTDADISLLVKALDLIKSQSAKPRIGSLFKELLVDSPTPGLPSFFKDELNRKDAEEKKEQEEIAENVIELQHKLMRFKRYLKQPSGPSMYQEQPEPLVNEETSAGTGAPPE